MFLLHSDTLITQQYIYNSWFLAGGLLCSWISEISWIRSAVHWIQLSLYYPPFVYCTPPPQINHSPALFSAELSDKYLLTWRDSCSWYDGQKYHEAALLSIIGLSKHSCWPEPSISPSKISQKSLFIASFDSCALMTLHLGLGSASFEGDITLWNSHNQFSLDSTSTCRMLASTFLSLI